MATPQAPTTSKPRRWTWWRTAWLVVLILAVGAGVYAAYKFAQYGHAKAEQLLQDGQTAEETLQLTQALTDYDGAIALRGVAGGSAAQAALRAAAIYTAKGQHDVAQDYLRQAVALQPADPSYAAALVRSLITTRGLDEATKVLSEAQQQSPTDADLLVAAVRLALAKQDGEAARDAARRAVQADGKDGAAVLLDALLRIHTAPAESAKAFDKLLTLTQDQALQALAQALRPIAQQIDAGLNNDAYEHVLVAATLLDHGEFDAARLESTQATDTSKDYRDGWVYRGAAELAIHDLDAAATSLARAKELNPTHGYTRSLLGQLAEARGNHDEAANQLREAIELGYDTVEVHVTLADVLSAAGKTDEARTTLQRALADHGTDRTLHEALFWLEYTRSGGAAAAKQVAEEFTRDVHGDPLAEGLLALGLFATGDTTGARKKAEAALATNPKLAVGYLVQGLLDDDRTKLEHAIDLDVEGHVSTQAESALNPE
ncbi:MAG: tetratricopeptide repeat protein [Candidatus Andersenbacteria bacterium]